jgi:hypothetical protein
MGSAIVTQFSSQADVPVWSGYQDARQSEVFRDGADVRAARARTPN